MGKVITKLNSLDRAAIDRILSATKEAPRGHEFDFSRIDKAALANDISLRAAICCAGHEVADEGLRKARQERRLKFQKLMQKAKALYQADLQDDRRIAQCYYPEQPDPLNVFSALEDAAQQASQPIVDPPHWGDVGERYVNVLTERNLVETIISQLAVVYEKHFGKKATYSNYTETSRHYQEGSEDGMFLRFASAILVELGILNKGQPYKLSYISRALDESRATNPRPRSKKNR